MYGGFPKSEIQYTYWQLFVLQIYNIFIQNGCYMSGCIDTYNCEGRTKKRDGVLAWKRLQGLYSLSGKTFYR